MPASILELFDGRSESIAGKLSATIPYAIIGATDEADARATALAAIPTTHNGVPRSGIVISERINTTTWKVIASYDQPDGGGGTDTATLEDTYTFEAGSVQTNVKQGYSGFGKRYSLTDPGTGATVESVIDFNDNEVKGANIIVPEFRWAETHWFSPAIVTEAYKSLVASCVGNINDRTFRTYPAGEVLFMGASGTRQGNGYWQITFNFARAKNQTNIPIGFSGIVVASKLGWQHMWIRYEDDIANPGTSSAHLIKRAAAAYIEDVYQATDLAGYLGI